MQWINLTEDLGLRGLEVIDFAPFILPHSRVQAPKLISVTLSSITLCRHLALLSIVFRVDVNVDEYLRRVLWFLGLAWNVRSVNRTIRPSLGSFLLEWISYHCLKCITLRFCVHQATNIFNTAWFHSYQYYYQFYGFALTSTITKLKPKTQWINLQPASPRYHTKPAHGLQYQSIGKANE